MRFELLGASGKRETRWLSVFGNGKTLSEKGVAVRMK